MYRYFATFPAGTDSIVKEILLSQPGVSIENTYTNMVIFKSPAQFQEVASQPFFSNCFKLISKFESRDMQDLVRISEWAFERDTFIQFLRTELGNRKMLFRFRFFEGSKTESMPRDLINDLMAFVIDNTKLKYSSTKPELEITFVKRSEGVSVVGLQYIDHKKYEPAPGELRPEIAYLMNYLSQPKRNDVFLDPFAGHGSLPIARSLFFHTKKLIVSDKTIKNFYTSCQKRNVKTDVFDIHEKDGFSLSWLQDNSVDTIVTDPPWGKFEQLKNPEDKYSQMFQNFTRVLTENGKCVVLFAKDSLIDSLIAEQQYLTIEKKLDVRIGGQSAVIIVFRK